MLTHTRKKLRAQQHRERGQEEEEGEREEGRECIGISYWTPCPLHSSSPNLTRLSSGCKVWTPQEM